MFRYIQYLSYVMLLASGILFLNPVRGIAQTPVKEELLVSFVGICTGNKVNVRAGADINYEVITQINKDNKIVILGKSYKWYKIKIPRGTDCFVHKDYIQSKDNLRMIKGDHINIRSAPDIKHSVLGQLNNNDPIKIKAREGDWYRIAAPKEFCAWVYSDFIKYYSTLAEFELEQERIGQRQDLFEQLEYDYKKQTAGSVFKADFSKLSKSYQQFLNKYPQSPESDIILKRIESLRLKIAEKEYKQGSAQLRAKIKAVEEEQRRREQAKILPPPTAVGQIEDLGMIINRPGTHKLITRGQTAYYLRSQKCDLNKHIYYPVRIWGQILTLPQWNKPVIEVRMVKPLED